MTLRIDRGSAIAEFGPILFVTLVLLLFPMLDMAALALQYMACTTLNDYQTQKAAQIPKKLAVSAVGPIIQDIPNNWRLQGIGAFVQVTGSPHTAIGYSKVGLADVRDEYVIVTTHVTVNPFLMIPLLPHVPGLSAPVNFRIRSQRLMEDPINQSKDTSIR